MCAELTVLVTRRPVVGVSTECRSPVCCATTPVVPSSERPLCGSCFDYEGAVIWNAHASRLWNRTVEQIRYGLAAYRSLSMAELRQVLKISYLKVAEYQRRGLVHFHLVLRVDGPETAFTDPPPWIDIDLLHNEFLKVVSKFELVGLGGRTIRWGSQLDVRNLVDDRSDLRVASYVAKYATKSTGDSLALARRFHSRREIDELRIEPHLRRMAIVAWDLSTRPELEPLNLRHHAHCLRLHGSAHHEISKLFDDIQGTSGIRREHMAQFNESDPVAGTFIYDGRGYDDLERVRWPSCCIGLAPKFAKWPENSV